jgi:hypothetical protein
VGQGPARARAFSRPNSGSVGLCARGLEGLQLMRKSLGRPHSSDALYFYACRGGRLAESAADGHGFTAGAAIVSPPG